MGCGVCGSAVAEKRTLLVPNVHEFPGHIACDSASNSEIVIPLMKDREVVGVLDIDSPNYSRFDERDRAGLEEFARIIEKAL
jgi:GAF domain-containing protein